MRISLLILLLVSLGIQAAEKSGRTCRVIFPNGPDDVPQTLHLFDGVGSQEIELTRMGFSPVYQVPIATLSLALLPSPPAPATAGSPPVIPAGAPQVTIAESITDFYLIVFSDPGNQVIPVKMQVINANPANFKRGQMLWFNLTENEVGGIVGSRKLLIQPHSRLVLEAPATTLEDYPVNIHFLPPGKQRPEPLCETNWTHDPRSRSVFFILKPADSLIPRILGFPDFRSEANANSEGGP